MRFSFLAEEVGATLQTAGRLITLTSSGSTSRWGRSGSTVQPPVSPRLCGHLVAETVDQLRGSPSSASAPWTGGGKKQLAAIGVYGNGAYELTELEVPGSYSNAASRNHRAVRVPPHRTKPGAAGVGWTTVKVMGPKNLVGE